MNLLSIIDPTLPEVGTALLTILSFVFGLLFLKRKDKKID